MDMTRMPWHDSPREPIEIVMRIAGHSTFRTTVGGRWAGAPTLTDNDICSAIAYARRVDDLGADLLLAAALPATADPRRLSLMTMSRAASLGLRHRMRDAANRCTAIEIAMRDAIAELVQGKALPRAEAAKLARMRRQDYVELQLCFAAVVQDAAPTAARAAVSYLFARG